MRAVALTTWLVLALAAALTAFGQVMLKLAAMQPGVQDAMRAGPVPFVVAAMGEPRLLAGVMLYGLSTGLWVVVLARVDLSLAYPMAASSLVLVMMFAWAGLGETISGMRLSGVALMLMGLMLIARSDDP